MHLIRRLQDFFFNYSYWITLLKYFTFSWVHRLFFVSKKLAIMTSNTLRNKFTFFAVQVHPFSPHINPFSYCKRTFMSMQEIFARFASASSRIILHRTRLCQWMLNIVMNKALSPKIIAANQLISGNSQNSVANKNWSQYAMWIIWVSRTYACIFWRIISFDKSHI